MVTLTLTAEQVSTVVQSLTVRAENVWREAEAAHNEPTLFGVAVELAELADAIRVQASLDTQTSVSVQHFIDTGSYLSRDETRGE